MTAKLQRVDMPHLRLVPASTPKAGLFALWHLLSLDAPTVAAVWTVFIARSVSLQLHWPAPVAMFLAVWMLYAADRLLDTRTASKDELEPRHHFHSKHRNAFLTSIVASSLLLVCLLPELAPAALRIDALLAVMLVTYFLLIHVGVPGSVRLPKELAVGLFFPAAVFVPTIARVPSLRLLLLPEALLFAAVCTLNCLYIYRWEHRAPYTKAHWTTRFAAAHLSELTLCVVLLSLLLLLTRHSTVATAAGLSAVVLLALNLMRKRISAVHLRACADLALLTPLLFPTLWR